MKLTRFSQNPILVPDSELPFEKAAVYNPCAAVLRNKVYMIYRAEGDYYDRYVSTLCLAISSDGIHFKKYKNNPVIKPSTDHESRGCEDPRITKVGSTFYMTYTAWAGHKVGVALATSKDLIHWHKHGVVLENTKSAQILSTPIAGHYFMLVGDMHIKLAHSKDLIHWHIEHEHILSPRSHKFDNELVEVGPEPILKNGEYIVIYNSSDNLGRYHASYFILDPQNPKKVLYRHNKPIFSPEEYYELYGKVNYVVFIEALVKFKNKYLVYYGAADKSIGGAVLTI